MSGDLYDVTSQNGYIYADNNPVMLTDDIGTIPLETVTDIVAVGVSGYNLIKEPSLKNAVALIGDVVAAVTPYVPSPTSVKVGSKVVAKSGKDIKTYQTYTKTNPTTGKIYAGRTSGYKGAMSNIEKRDKNHHMNAKGYGPAKLDKSSADYNAIRGREQQLIDKYSGQGVSGNSINGISPQNKRKDIYMSAARKEFGN